MIKITFITIMEEITQIIGFFVGFFMGVSIFVEYVFDCSVSLIGLIVLFKIVLQLLEE